jgi:hypothetical protein
VQETVNGVTFNPASLFFVLVGVDLEGKPFEDESWRHPLMSSYSEAETHAKHLLDRSALATYVRVMSYLSDGMSIRVSTVWR